MALAALQLRDILDKDLDVAFSYQTPMMANIKDRYLGILALCIKLSILFYVVIYVFIIVRAQIMWEYAQGKVLFYSSGTAFSQVDNNTVRIWDNVDAIWPKDPSNLFIPTRIVETVGERRGTCTDLARPCTRDSQCMGSCLDNFCFEPSWCSNSTPIVHYLQGVQNFMFFVQADIEFIELAKNHDFSTMDETGFTYYPDDGPNVFLIADLLNKLDLDYSDIRDTGCVLKVKMRWGCKINSDYNCDDPDLKVHRLDDENDNDPNGFRFNRYFYYRENGEEVRDHWNLTGIYIIGTTEGKAHQISLTSIIANVSASINLLIIAELVSDFLMLNCMKHRKEYRRTVVEETHDVQAQLEGLADQNVAKEEAVSVESEDFFEQDL